MDLLQPNRPNPVAETLRKIRGPIVVCALSALAACRHELQLTAWTTGEPNAPAEVADVYRAVLDEIFPLANGPSLIVMDQRAEPSWVELTAKHTVRRPPPLIEPFPYRIPIVFIDTAAQQDLNREMLRADSVAYTVPMTDIRYRQRWARPFIEKFRGAWGMVRLGRVGLGPELRYAVLDVWYSDIAPRESDQETFWLAREGDKWSVVNRVPRSGIIQPKPLPERMFAGWVDSSAIPMPQRRPIQGSVRDSITHAPVAGIAVQIKSMPLNGQGQMIFDRGPQPWTTVFTDSAGAFIVMNPPRGYAYIEAVCPPTGGLPGGGLAYAALDPEAGVDTVINLRVRMTLCPELARFAAEEAKRHRDDVVRAKAESAARVVQGNIWGTLRDSRTSRPVARAAMRMDERGGIGITDSVGHFRLWGFAPGKHKIILYCPVRRQWMGMGKIASTLAIDAPPAMKDTIDINIDMAECQDVPVDTVRVRAQGVLSEGFEDGFFTPCKPFTEIKLGGYRDWSHLAFLEFAHETVGPPGGWPKVKPVKGYYKTFMDVDGDLIGPGSYGHLGIATYILRVSRVRSAKAATGKDCTRSDSAGR